MTFEIFHRHYHHQESEVHALVDGLHRKLDIIIERLNHMATQDQINKLTADIGTLITAIGAYQASVTAAIAAAQAASPDPAIDTLDATITGETAKLAAATAPVAAPAAPATLAT